MSQTENNETDEKKPPDPPVRISAAIYTDTDDSEHILLEARQGSFLLRHFMSSEDARAIGIALCDMANEVELAGLVRSQTSLPSPFEGFWARPPHTYRPPVQGDNLCCTYCGLPEHYLIHKFGGGNAT